jgi:hypothetical protein
VAEGPLGGVNSSDKAEYGRSAEVLLPVNLPLVIGRSSIRSRFDPETMVTTTL